MKFKTEFFSRNLQSPLPPAQFRPGRLFTPRMQLAKPRSGWFFSGLLLVMLFFVSNSYAFDWIHEYNMIAIQRYTDNLRMQIQPARSNLITTLSPTAVLGYLDDDNELRIKLNLNQLVYDDESNMNFSEKIATLIDTYHNEKWTTTLTARYGYESSMATQLNENGSGNLLYQVPRESLTLTPDVAYKLSEKNSVEVYGTFMDVSFASHPTNGYDDYTNQTLNGVFNHQYTERLSLNVNTGYTLYNAGNTINAGNFTAGQTSILPVSSTYRQNSTTLSYQLGFKYGYDEKTSITGSAGLRDSTTNSTYLTSVNGLDCYSQYMIANQITCPNSSQFTSSATSGKIYSALIKRDLEKGVINLSYNQQLNPASTGSQQQTQQFSALLSYDITERWNTGLNYSYLISQYVAGYNNSSTLVNLNNRTFSAISSSVKWKWTPEMSFQFSYTYMDQVYTYDNQTAIGNNMQLQFNYQPQTNRQVK
jgi:hypothetical protein